MSDTHAYSSDVAFTPAVKAIQARKGSRDGYAHVEDLSWDAMKMHLPLAQYYLQSHALEPKPDLIYSYFPQATESMLALAWALGGQAAAQFIAPMFFLLALLALWILARDCAANFA